MFDIVFLGTGSAIPTSRRNLSGVACIRKGSVFLFDCGEATQIQYRRAKLRPGRLRYIFISHFHGDHLFGLPGMLTSLQMSDCRQEIHIFGPKGLSDYIQFHQELCRFTINYPLVVHEIDEQTDRRLLEEDEFYIEWQPLKHRIFTAGFAVVEKPRPGKFNIERAESLGVPNGSERGELQSGKMITLENGQHVYPSDVLGPSRPGIKIAYCTDTSPCSGEKYLAHQANALIADATFPSAETTWANKTGHSTVSDAAHLAKECGVRRLFLTHFSGTIKPSELPALAEEARLIFPNSTTATDLARFTIKPKVAD